MRYCILRPLQMASKITTKKSEELFNCSNLSKFKASIIQVLPYHGISSSKFYLCSVEGVQFLVKLYFFRLSSPEIYGKINKSVVSQGDAELNILRILRDNIINHNITSCILELIDFKICNSLDKFIPKSRVCEQLLISGDVKTPEEDVDFVMCEHSDLVKAKLAHNKCVFMVLEKCDLTLHQYLDRMTGSPVNFAVFKSLLFQITYAMYAINTIYPKFRHYDLHTDNIMLKLNPNFKFNAAKPLFMIFTINKQKYAIPYFGIIPKIIDFGFSMLPEEHIVSDITKDRVQMYYRSQNDLLWLFHWIFRNIPYGSDKMGHIENLLKQLEPNQTYTHFNTEYIRKHEHKIPTYAQMIQNPVWSEYKKYNATSDQIFNEFTVLD